MYLGHERLLLQNNRNNNQNRLNGGKHCTGQAGGNNHRRQCGSGRSRSKSGGACDASSVDLGHTLDLRDQIRGRAAVVRQRGGDAHGNLRYDCKQPDWGPECR